MAEIKPFKGYFYNQQNAGNLDNLVSPPYDIIDSDYREKLVRTSEFNITNLLLPYSNENENYYQRVKNTFNTWIEKKIILQDESENFYFLRQNFLYKNEKIERIGFFGILSLKDVKNVVRHEHIIKKYSEDRKKLLETAKTNFEPIFLLYEDGEYLLDKIIVEEKNSFQNTEFENIKNSFGRIKNKELFSPLLDKIKNNLLYIADGHHRFSASLEAYLKNQDSVPENILVYFTNLLSKNLLILPTHRLIYSNIPWNKIIQAITPYFSIERFINFSSLTEALSKAGDNSFGVYGTGRFYLWKLINRKNIEKFLPYSNIEEWSKIDVVILHYFILKEIFKLSPEEKIFYERDEKLIFEKAKKDPKNFVFFLNPTDINDLKIISQKGGILPAKTTYFYPKIPSGLIFYKAT